jgi:excisionase family DNA binding protein
MKNSMQIMRPRELCKALNISISTLYRWHSDGDMPIKKIKFGRGVVGYRRSDVEAWLNGELEEESKL